MDVEEEIVTELESFENQDGLLGSEEIVEDYNILQESLEIEASESIDNKSENVNIKLLKIPLARIKTIIKTDSEVSLASHDAVVLIAKATEFFVQSLTKQAYEFTNKAKRKTIQRKDIDNAINSTDVLAFLEGIFDD